MGQVALLQAGQKVRGSRRVGDGEVVAVGRRGSAVVNAVVRMENVAGGRPTWNKW